MSKNNLLRKKKTKDFLELFIVKTGKIQIKICQRVQYF